MFELFETSWYLYNVDGIKKKMVNTIKNCVYCKKNMVETIGFSWTPFFFYLEKSNQNYKKKTSESEFFLTFWYLLKGNN